MPRPVSRLFYNPITICVFCTLIAVGLLAQDAGEVDTFVTFRWTPPTYGPPVHHYAMQILINDQDLLTVDDITSEFYALPIQYGNKYLIRVAGIDAAGNQGDFSIWSLPLNIEEYNDPPFNPG